MAEDNKDNMSSPELSIGKTAPRSRPLEPHGGNFRWSRFEKEELRRQIMDEFDKMEARNMGPNFYDSPEFSKATETAPSAAQEPSPVAPKAVENKPSTPPVIVPKRAPEPAH